MSKTIPLPRINDAVSKLEKRIFTFSIRNKNEAKGMTLFLDRLRFSNGVIGLMPKPMASTIHCDTFVDGYNIAYGLTWRILYGKQP